MSNPRKVTFTLSIGYGGAKYEEEFDVKDDFGFDPDALTEEEFNKEVEECYMDWRGNYLDGWWRASDE